MHGFADDRFAAVRAVFEDGLASGDEVGASVCVNVAGETVVDLWGGFADAARTRPWQRETIVNVYSVTKTMTALTALLLADRGELDLTAPVSRSAPISTSVFRPARTAAWPSSSRRPRARHRSPT